MERFESLKELLKIEKAEAKEKEREIAELRERVVKLERANKELKEDYSNL